MPAKKNYRNRRRIPRNKKRVNRKASKAVRSFPRQLQNASYMPKSRLLKFTDFRSYVVTDDGFNASGALPPVFEIAANNPRKFRHGTQGLWDAASITKKEQAVPGLNKWITNANPTSSSTAPYLNGSALSCRVDITCTPMPTVPSAGNEQDTYQDVIKLCVQNNTRNGMFTGRNIDNNFNSEVVSQTPYVRSANMYYNHNGTPRGASISLNYSFKKSNAGRAPKSYANLFHLDADPIEKDFINIALLPTHSQKYGLSALGGQRLPNHRVEIKISYIVLLSEPNGHVGLEELNQGINLAKVVTAQDNWGKVSQL